MWEALGWKNVRALFVCRCAAALFVVLLQRLQTLHLFANLPSCRSAEMAVEIAMDGAAQIRCSESDGRKEGTS